MSMIMSLKQAPPATLDLLVERPELAVVFWMDPRYKPPKQPGWVKWLARMLGGYTPPMELPEPPPELARNGESIGLEKSWHGLQWLLTKPHSRSEGDEWEIAPPEGFLLSAGQPIEGSDHGYGDERAVSPEDVAAFDGLLKNTPWPEVASRFDAEAMASAQVYPNEWDRAGELDQLREGYDTLSQFIAHTHADALGLVIQIS